MNVLPLGKKLTVAIDIDGTIAHCSKVDFNKVDKDPNELLKAEPKKEALKSVKKLYKRGHKIVFYSSRNKQSEQVTKRWLKLHGFPFHHVVMEKFVAHVYIDDRAINGCNWKQVLKEFDKPGLPGRIAREKGRI